MSLRDVLLNLADKTQRDVLALHQRLVAGTLTRSQFVRLAAAVIARANVRATTTADLAVAASILAALRQPTPPAGIEPSNHQERLRASVETVLDEDIDYPDTPAEEIDSVEKRLARLARAEPLSAGQTALIASMGAQGVPGWVRSTGPKPCPLCVRWADGVTRPTTVRMARHTGCSCTAQPSF